MYLCIQKFYIVNRLIYLLILALRHDVSEPTKWKRAHGAARRIRSQSEIAPQKSSLERAGSMLRAVRLRGRDLAQRDKAQGGRGRCAIGHTIRHIYWERLYSF